MTGGFVFEEKKGIIGGGGKDEIGEYQWSGTYNDRDLEMRKQYIGKHCSKYKPFCGTIILKLSLSI